MGEPAREDEIEPPCGTTGGPPPGAGPTPMDEFVDFLCELYPTWKEQCDSKASG